VRKKGRGGRGVNIYLLIVRPVYAIRGWGVQNNSPTNFCALSLSPLSLPSLPLFLSPPFLLTM
jgi:hypothetical protein